MVTVVLVLFKRASCLLSLKRESCGGQLFKGCIGESMTHLQFDLNLKMLSPHQNLY